MEFFEYAGYENIKECFSGINYAIEIYGDETPEAFIGRMYPTGYFDTEFFYSYLCYVYDCGGFADSGREKFVKDNLPAFSDFYDSFHSEYTYSVPDYLYVGSYSSYCTDNVLDYADAYCGTLLQVYMENSTQTTLPPSVTENPAASPEPVTSPELSAVPEPSVLPGPSVLPEPAASAVPSVTAGAVTPGGAVADIPYETGLLLRELQKTNMLLSGVLFTLLFFWLVKKARTIVGGMTDDGKTG